MIRALLLVALALCAACDDAAPVDAAVDAAADAVEASPPDAEADAVADAARVDDRFAPVGPEGALALGTGPEGFVALADEDTVTLHRGCQGAQHIWLSLRLPAGAPGQWPLQAAALDADDRPLAPVYRLADEPWQGAPDGGAEITGLTLVIFQADAVVGARVRLWAQVDGPDGPVSATRWVRVEWGADAC